MSRLFQHGAYWARTLEAMRTWVRDNLQVYVGAPPTAASELFQDLQSYALYHHRRFETAGIDGPESESESVT